MWSSRKESIAAGRETRCRRMSERISSRETGWNDPGDDMLRDRDRETGEDPAEIGERGADVEPGAVDLGVAELGGVGDAARFQDRDGAFQAPVQFDVAQEEEVVGAGEDALTGQAG